MKGFNTVVVHPSGLDLEELAPLPPAFFFNPVAQQATAMLFKLGHFLP